MALSISAAARRQITNGLTAFSAGTLCFIRRWYDLEHLQPRGLDYFRTGPPTLTLLEATVVASMILAAALWAAWYVVQRSGAKWLRTLAYGTFLLMLMYPIESVRRYWNTQTEHFDIGSNFALWLVETLLAAGVVMVLRGNLRILYSARRATLLLLLLLPALMIDFSTNHLSAEQPKDYAPLPPATVLPAHKLPGQRVVWVIFDELDQRLAFERRPQDLKLLELDRLRSESVSGEHALESATFTAIALPSLISGRMFSNAQALDARTLKLIPQGSNQSVDWRNEPNVFTRARALGMNSALSGWHHPYCRIFGDQLVDCFAMGSTHSTTALAEETEADKDGLWKTVGVLFAWKLPTIVNMVTGRAASPDDLRDEVIQQGQQKQYFEIRDHAYRYAADPRIDLLLVHFPTPHMFPIYNRREQNFHITPGLDYFDNLALVDRTLGELRRTIEQTGLGDRTTILVTADHGFRPGNWFGRIGWTEEIDRASERQPPSTVPFMLKVGGQSQKATVETPFCNVAAEDLVLAVLEGNIRTSRDAAAWLSQRAANESRVEAVTAKVGTRAAP